jgi:mRNA interferase RelE/StbE
LEGYCLRYRKAAIKALARMPASRRQQFEAAFERLVRDPDAPELDVRPLTGRSGYRLRIGRWRALYHRDDEALVILVLEVGSRGDVYK